MSGNGLSRDLKRKINIQLVGEMIRNGGYGLSVVPQEALNDYFQSIMGSQSKASSQNGAWKIKRRSRVNEGKNSPCTKD